MSVLNINSVQNRVWKHKVESVNLGGKQLDRFIKHSSLSGSNAVLTFVMA